MRSSFKINVFATGKTENLVKGGGREGGSDSDKGLEVGRVEKGWRTLAEEIKTRSCYAPFMS